MAAKKKEKAQATERMYTILQAPHVTEKATLGSQYNQVTFRVPMDATKPEIKSAVETLYKVGVTGVNTLITKGKTKRFRGVKAFRSDAKKAIVTLKQGDTIDVGAGV